MHDAYCFNVVRAVRDECRLDRVRISAVTPVRLDDSRFKP